MADVVQVVSFCFLLAFGVLGSALVAGCTDSLPACMEDISGLFRAELTGAPSFSAPRIALGDPLSIAVPVDENTLKVRVTIRSAGDTFVADLVQETDGDEVVELPLEDTNLPPGVYFADRIFLTGRDPLPEDAVYHTPDSNMLYVLFVSIVPEGGVSCLTNIAVPTFTVVSEESSGAR